MTLSTNTEAVSELLPCPFCGEAAEMEHDETSDYAAFHTWNVACSRCDARGPQHQGKNEAVDTWNRRSEVPHFDRTRCATEGCGKVATEYFERGGVGSYHCGDCTAKINALSRRSASNAGRVEVKARQALAVYGKWVMDVATLGELADLEARMAAVGVTLQDVGEWSNPPSLAAEAEPVAWRPMKDAPRGFPIVIKQGQWIATVILNPPSEEGHWTDGDSVIHYNGNVLVSGFHGTYDGWLPAGSTIPHPSSPVSAEVTVGAGWEEHSLEEKQSVQKHAGIPHLPTDMTYEARLAVSGRGPRAYEWSDKKHRLVYDLCREIERIASINGGRENG